MQGNGFPLGDMYTIIEDAFLNTLTDSMDVRLLSTALSITSYCNSEQNIINCSHNWKCKASEP